MGSQRSGCSLRDMLGGGVSDHSLHNGRVVRGMRAAGPGTCVRVNEVLGVSIADVVEQGGLVQVHQLRVVANSVEVCWVDRLRNRVVEVCVLCARVQTGTWCRHAPLQRKPDRVWRRVHTFGPASSLSLTFMLSVSSSWCRTSPRAYPSPGYGNQKWGSSFSSSCVGASARH